jgi:hypothetical protein
VQLTGQNDAMARWQEIERESPQVAQRARAAFDAHKHKTMATLRKDGSPRISGTEVEFFDGDVYLGSMTGAVKARDLQRDPRVALHSATVDPEMVGGDAKIAGRAVEITDEGDKAAFMAHHAAGGDEQPPGDFHLFRIDVTEVATTSIGDPPDHLVIESWHQDRGTRRVERK